MNEKEIINLNNRILENSGINNFIRIIRDEYSTKNIPYLELEERANFSSCGEYPSNLTLEVKSELIQTDNYKISSKYVIPSQNTHHISEKELSDLRANAIISESEIELAKLVLNKIKELAELSFKESLKWFDRLLYKIYSWSGKTYNKKTKIKSSGDLTNLIQFKINKIFRKSRNNGTPYIICSYGIAGFLELSSGFIFTDLNTFKSLNPATPYYIGSVGNIKIFVDPHMRFGDNTVYIGVINSNETISAPELCLYLHEKGTKFKEYLDTKDVNNIRLNLNLALFTIGENPHHNFDKIVVKLPKKYKL